MTAREHIEAALAAMSLGANDVHLRVALVLIEGGRPLQAAYNLGAWVASGGAPKKAVDHVTKSVTALETEYGVQETTD